MQSDQEAHLPFHLDRHNFRQSTVPMSSELLLFWLPTAPESWPLSPEFPGDFQPSELPLHEFPISQNRHQTPKKWWNPQAQSYELKRLFPWLFAARRPSMWAFGKCCGSNFGFLDRAIASDLVWFWLQRLSWFAARQICSHWSIALVFPCPLTSEILESLSLPLLSFSQDLPFWVQNCVLNSCELFQTSQLALFQRSIVLRLVLLLKRLYPT